MGAGGPGKGARKASALGGLPGGAEGGARAEGGWVVVVEEEEVVVVEVVGGWGGRPLLLEVQGGHEIRDRKGVHPHLHHPHPRRQHSHPQHRHLPHTETNRTPPRASHWRSLATGWPSPARSPLHPRGPGLLSPVLVSPSRTSARAGHYRFPAPSCRRAPPTPPLPPSLPPRTAPCRGVS